MDAPRWLDYVPIEDLPTDPANPKGHDGAVIRRSIEELGYIEPIVLDERTGRIVSGHGRREQLLAIREGGGQPPEGIVVADDGRWTAPVMRGWSSESDGHARTALVVLNRAVEAGGWQPQPLVELLEAIDAGPVDLDLTGFTAPDLSALLEQLKPEEPERKRPHADRVPPTPLKRVEAGQLWGLGRHRLLCGDSFDPADVDRLCEGKPVDLVLTDPPFAIYGSASGISAEVADDSMVRPFFEQLGRTIHARIVEFGHVYIHCDWRSYATLWDGMKRAQLAPKNCLVWDKGNFGLGANWPNAHEFIAFFTKLPRSTTMTSNQKSGQRQVLNHSNILRFERPRGDDRQHNAAKPVDLLKLIMEKASDPGTRVLDLFGGSGSTLIAAEQAGRTCLMMEKEARHGDTICARFEEQTGVAPVRLD